MSLSKKYIIIGLIVILLILGAVIAFNNPVQSQETAKNNTSVVKTVHLGGNDLGYAEKIGPFGNASSKTKIAYIIGVHPLEYKAHNAMYDAMTNNSASLKYCYYVYRINVTKNAEDYSSGRLNGQKLAREFVVEDVKKQDYDLVIDIHSFWSDNRFVFVPIDDKKSKSIANKLVSNISWLKYYSPPGQKSPPYVTIPILKSGTRTIVFENYKYQEYSVSKPQYVEFIKAVDTLEF
ncbi:hypothetical protein [Methanobacterium alcaliphilum]|uniref:hypothetical protein n=1 Tax=Methanobacterium alcaliphilum TaxID=392018 RepID=UPI00200A1381|nr:hypothetical protein [Methanobacterium alcaliphilum]MCK9151682.1 hypothetical protein [Methanobacterium alcaliphilum]